MNAHRCKSVHLRCNLHCRYMYKTQVCWCTWHSDHKETAVHIHQRLKEQFVHVRKSNCSIYMLLITTAIRQYSIHAKHFHKEHISIRLWNCCAEKVECIIVRRHFTVGEIVLYSNTQMVKNFSHPSIVDRFCHQWCNDEGEWNASKYNFANSPCALVKSM